MSDKSRLENNNLILQNITNTVMNLPDYIEIKNQDINVTENGLYMADSGYTGLGTVIVNVSGGEGDVKQFDSIANMQADPNPTEGGLAIVYYSTGGNLTAETEFQVATFPESVTLPNAITNLIDLQFKAVDETVMFGCFGDIISTGFSMYCSTDGGTIRIGYTSSDGINYTRTVFQKNQEEISGTEMDFGTTIIFGDRFEEPIWDDAIGYFIQTGITAFEGLYQYTNNSYSLASTQFTADNRYVFDKSFYGVSGVDTGTLQNVENLTLDEVRLKAQVFSDLSYLTPSNDIIDMSNMFSGKSKLTTIPNLDTSNVTNMAEMFVSCSNLKTIPNFNTSNVTNMRCMFGACTNLTLIPNLDTSNVTNMQSMFTSCINLINVSEFDTSNVENMGNMFYDCTNLVSVSNFNINNATYMYFMFYNCTNLVSVSNFNINNATHMHSMFENCTNLVSVSNFNINNAIGIINMFKLCNNLSVQSVANIVNGLPNSNKLTSGNHSYSSIYNSDSNSPLSIPNLTEEQQNILGNKGYIEFLYRAVNTSNISYYWNIQADGTWKNTSKVSAYNIDPTGSLIGANARTATNNLYVLDTGNEGTLYYSNATFKNLICKNVTIQMNGSKFTDMYQMFWNCRNLISVTLNFSTDSVKSTRHMFGRCSNLTSVPNFNTSNVTNMQSMFLACSNLKTIPEYDTHNVTDMSSMFAECRDIENVPNLDTSCVTNMEQMFEFCSNLTAVSNFNTSNAKNMYRTFDSCINLTSVYDIDTSNVTNAIQVFFNCTNLSNVSQFNISENTNWGHMFQYCNNLSNASIQNIINTCLNSNITNSTMKNLNNTNGYSLLVGTKFDNSYYQNRWAELDAAGWTY